VEKRNYFQAIRVFDLEITSSNILKKYLIKIFGHPVLLLPSIIRKVSCVKQNKRNYFQAIRVFDLEKARHIRLKKYLIKIFGNLVLLLPGIIKS
jgi:hypothetical protein